MPLGRAISIISYLTKNLYFWAKYHYFAGNNTVCYYEFSLPEKSASASYRDHRIPSCRHRVLQACSGRQGRSPGGCAWLQRNGPAIGRIQRKKRAFPIVDGKHVQRNA